MGSETIEETPGFTLDKCILSVYLGCRRAFYRVSTGLGFLDIYVYIIDVIRHWVYPRITGLKSAWTLRPRSNPDHDCKALENPRVLSSS